jgi:hypothetical protein
LKKGLRVVENSAQAPRPMTLGEILDRTVRLYSRNWRVFLPLTLIVAVMQFLVITPLSTWLEHHPGDLVQKALTFSTQSLIVGRIQNVITNFLEMLLAQAFFIAALNAITGNRTSFSGVARQGFDRPVSIAIFSLFRVVIYYILPAIPLLLFAGWVNLFRSYEYATDSAKQAGSVLLVIALFVEFCIILYLNISFELSVPAFVQEKLSPWQALKRGWNLADEARGRIALIYLLITFLAICFLVPYAIFEVMFAKVYPVLKTGELYGVPYKVLINQLFLMPVALLLNWVYPIAMTIIYFDQRIRQEGLTFAEILRGPGPQQSASAATINSDTLSASGVVE